MVVEKGLVVMKKEKKMLRDLDYYVLSALRHLGPESYGVPIHQMVEDVIESFVAIGSVYAALDRLERNGFVSSRIGEATPERGGRAKKYFKIEGAGVAALKEEERMRRAIASKLTWQPAGGRV